MRTGLNISGAILVVFGGVWFLQGINVLPGSFMTGRIRWAIIGGIAVVAGIALLTSANRRHRYREAGSGSRITSVVMVIAALRLL